MVIAGACGSIAIVQRAALKEFIKTCEAISRNETGIKKMCYPGATIANLAINA